MNNAAVPRRADSVSKWLGFGYEVKSGERPSVQTARAEFLGRIAEIKPSVVFGLFEACYPRFVEFLEQSEQPLSGLYNKAELGIPSDAYILRQPKFITEKALKLLIPNWQSLKAIEGADKLRLALENWTIEHNLTATWCRDDVLQFLRTFEVSEEKKTAFALPNLFLKSLIKQSWQSTATHRRLLGLHSIYQSNLEVEKRGAFSFKFDFGEIKFQVSGPFNKSPAAFKQEVENQFKARNGHKVSGARKHLAYQMGEYFEKVSEINRQLDLTVPPRLRKADLYLKWLVDYQIPPIKNYRQIAREVSKDEKTVREGIERIASLIGLTLRSNEADKHSGRPKGSKDRGPRRRVAATKRKLRGNAN